MSNTCVHCQNKFLAPSKLAEEHGSACPPCYDLWQILAFANSAGDTVTTEEALSVIKGICRTRLERKKGDEG